LERYAALDRSAEEPPNRLLLVASMPVEDG